MSTAAGASGDIRHGYQTAARLGPWRMESDGPRRFRCSAIVTYRHASWLAASPLDLRLRIGDEFWVWHGVSPAWEDDAHVSFALTSAPAVEPG